MSGITTVYRLARSHGARGQPPDRYTMSPAQKRPRARLYIYWIVESLTIYFKPLNDFLGRFAASAYRHDIPLLTVCTKGSWLVPVIFASKIGSMAYAPWRHRPVKIIKYRLLI